MLATIKLAHAAGQDAGNRSMKAAGRTVWNEDDYQAACDAVERVMATMSDDDKMWKG